MEEEKIENKNEKEFGARPIIRAVQTEIEDKITDLILDNDYEKGYTFKVTYPQRLVSPEFIGGVVREEPSYDTLLVE